MAEKKQDAENIDTPKDTPATPKKSFGSRLRSIRKYMMIGCLVIIIILLLTSIGTTGYFYQSSQDKSNQIEELEEKLDDLEVEADESSDSGDTCEEQKDGIQDQLDVCKEDAEENSAILDQIPNVIFTPGGKFNTAKRAELKKKLTGPMIDYYEMSGEAKVVSVQVDDTTALIPDSDYQYGIDVIFLKEDSYMGFVYGEKGKALDYWYPECFESICEFTSEYQAKHPETVAKYKEVSGS